MRYVEIYKLNDNGSQSVIATCSLYNEAAKCEGNTNLVRNLYEEGILNHDAIDERKTLFPKDGLKFLEQLKHNFTSGYLNASDIKEK